MRVGLFLPSVSPFATPEFLTAYAETAEDSGFSSIWIGEHVVFFDEYESKYPYAEDGRLMLSPDTGLLDQFTTLSFLASVTDRVRLGTAVCLLPQRNPVYTAKEAATVDWLSNGRLDVGLGIGWLREEFDVLAAPFAQRAARTRDYLAVMRTLWRDEVSSYDGEFYTLPECRFFPKPVQAGGPPIYFGGESDAALRRVAEVGDGWHGFNHLPESAAASLARLEPMLSDAGRSLDDVTIVIGSYLQNVEPSHLSAYADVGVDELVLTAFGVDPQSAREAVKGLADQFVSKASSM